MSKYYKVVIKNTWTIIWENDKRKPKKDCYVIPIAMVGHDRRHYYPGNITYDSREEGYNRTKIEEKLDNLIHNTGNCRDYSDCEGYSCCDLGSVNKNPNQQIIVQKDLHPIFISYLKQYFKNIVFRVDQVHEIRINYFYQIEEKEDTSLNLQKKWKNLKKYFKRRRDEPEAVSLIEP